MKPCKHCGLDAEHDPNVCKVLIREKQTNKPKIAFGGNGRRNKEKGPVQISRKSILELADYLNGRR